MFKPIDPKPDFPKLEEEILKFWEDNQIFEKSLEQTKTGERFVFFEGPPTANGKPGLHHVEARAFKDLIPRFQTMLGKFVLRKGGWDTHGLPVELEVEKKLGISGKKQIESIKPTVRESIIEFNRLCKESVWNYKTDWEALTKRMGFWIDLKNPYVTYHNSYIESVWWVIKQIWDKGLVYLGHKVVPYCPRCGTALSSHEVAQGYKNIVDQSVFVKFRLKSQKDTYILSWTTTSWTLPGNVALAVGMNIDYVKIKLGEEFYILAKDRLSTVIPDLIGDPAEKFKGSDLVGLEYQPLFDIPSLKSDKSYKVYPADFVTTTDGTGVVHTAVMYGEEDYELGTKIGLPHHHTVDEAGRFTEEVKELAGLKVRANETDIKIFEYLKVKGLLFKIEPYAHDYPFCWRCGTALLYYARDSWFIEMSKLRDQLKANNEQINWVPEYIKHGRFGEWLDGVKDWAISRERYWGTPLPIWQCQDCKKYSAIGSVKELGLEKNIFIFSRHGEAEHNVDGIVSCYPEKIENNLTTKGVERSRGLASWLEQNGGVDLIFASDLTRTRQTAENVGKLLDVPVILDTRLREFNVGVYNGKSKTQFDQDFPFNDRWTKHPEGGETNQQAQQRIVDFIQDINKKYNGKKILVVSHGDPLFLLMKYFGSESTYPKYATVIELGVSIVDLHRPYIDEVTLKCAVCGGKSSRVPAVMDVWLDSGAMPYAQWHYPFENQDKIDQAQQFPADYISEAIDQTRGWFYTLLAISTLLGKEPAYKNVINLGHLLDTKGQKMSKSKGNVIDPWSVINKSGVDALRWFMYSVNQPGDSKLFGERDAEMVLRKNFVILWNVLSFFVTYANYDNWNPSKTTKQIDLMDKWVLIRLQDVTNQVTESLEKFDVFHAARILEDFINELSTWFVRRSRDHKGDAVYQTLHTVLKSLACLFAPFTPFLSESMWQVLKSDSDKESVHLAKWPEKKELSKDEKQSLADMQLVKDLVEQGHSLRKAANIKLRQPLNLFVYKGKLNKEFEKILAEELNVKSVKSGDQLEFDTAITKELKKEGLARELERTVQEMRKQKGLKVGEEVRMFYDTKEKELIDALTIFDKRKTYVREVKPEPELSGETFLIEGLQIVLKI